MQGQRRILTRAWLPLVGRDAAAMRLARASIHRDTHCRQHLRVGLIKTKRWTVGRACTYCAPSHCTALSPLAPACNCMLATSQMHARHEPTLHARHEPTLHARHEPNACSPPANPACSPPAKADVLLSTSALRSAREPVAPQPCLRLSSCCLTNQMQCRLVSACARCSALLMMIFSCSALSGAYCCDPVL